MPASTYKPLFNRRYLLALMWIIPIVILLLNTTGRDQEPTPLNIAWQDDPRHWRLSYNNLPSYQLRAIRPLAPGWNLSNHLQRAEILNSLEHWLANAVNTKQLNEFDWQASIQTLRSAIQLTISMNQAPTHEQLAWLSSALKQLPNAELNDRQRLIATWQLDQRQAENRLLATFESWLFAEPGDLLDWTILLSGPNLSTSSAVSELPSVSVKSLASANIMSEEAHVAETHHLLAWQMPLSEDAADLARQRLSINTIQQALDSLPDRPTYRLVWNPLPPKSYLLIITQGQSGNRLDEQLRELLLGINSDSLINKVVEQAIDQHQSANSTAMNATEWFELSALLNFPVESDLIYREAVMQLTPDDLRQHLAKTLDSQHQVKITLKPY